MMIEPTKINFEERFEEVKFKEKIKVRTIEIKTCSNSNEMNDLIQDLKKIAVDEFAKQIKAKGESKTNIFTKTYRTEYVIVRLKRPKDKKLFIKPSKEKTSKEDESIEMTEFKF